MAQNDRLSVEIVRGLDQWLEAFAVRAMIYVGEQDWPFADEFDGGDLSGATHLVARMGREPVGACRVRWYADFAKLERVAVKPAHRSGRVPRALWRAVADLAGRKGYRRVLGHIEGSLLAFWSRAAGFAPRVGRPTYVLGGREFVEAVAELPEHPMAISIDAPPQVVLACDAELGGAHFAPLLAKAS